MLAPVFISAIALRSIMNCAPPFWFSAAIGSSIASSRFWRTSVWNECDFLALIKSILYAMCILDYISSHPWYFHHVHAQWLTRFWHLACSCRFVDVRVCSDTGRIMPWHIPVHVFWLVIASIWFLEMLWPSHPKSSWVHCPAYTIINTVYTIITRHARQHIFLSYFGFFVSHVY